MQKLHQLVIQQMSPGSLPDDEATLAACFEQVQEERELMTRRLLDATHLNDNREDRQALVRQHQASLTRLLDSLYYYISVHRSATGRSAQDGPDHKMACYRKVEESLQDVMIGLEQHFSEYMELDAHLPFSYTRLARKQLGMRLREVDWLADAPGLEPALAELIFRPVRALIDNTGGRVTFRMLFYCRNLLSQLVQLTTLDVGPAGLFDLQMHGILLKMNFNAPAYYCYCTERIRTRLKQYPKLTERIACLSRFIREVSRISPENPELALDTTQPHICMQLLNWLKEEKQYLQELHAASRDARILTNVTLPQLTLLVRLFIDEGIIANTSTEQVLRSVASVMAVNQPDAAAGDNFEARYHHPALATIQSCKATVARLATRLREYEMSRHAYAD